MSKVTITITDKPEGGVNIVTRFTPPIEEEKGMTEAQDLGVSIMNILQEYHEEEE